jgi:hypothetical protein
MLLTANFIYSLIYLFVHVFIPQRHSVRQPAVDQEAEQVFRGENKNLALSILNTPATGSLIDGALQLNIFKFSECSPNTRVTFRLSTS